MSPSFAPPSRSPRKSLWAQPWPLLVTATALMFSVQLPLEAKAVVLLACVAITVLVWNARRRDVVPPVRSRKPTVVGGESAGTGKERWASHRAALYQMGDGMVANSVRAGEPMSVLAFEALELPELRVIFGAAAAQALVVEFGAKLRQLAGPRGVAVRMDAASWVVLLPGHDSHSAMDAVRRTLGPSLAVEAASDDEEILLVPHIAVLTVGQVVAPMRALYRDLRQDIQSAHEHELLRQDYLRRERESHSRPAPLPA